MGSSPVSPNRSDWRSSTPGVPSRCRPRSTTPPTPDPDLPPGFVAEAIDDPRTPPAHLTGGTVDLTLSHDGIPLALGTTFDDFTATAHADHFEDPAPAAEKLLVVRDLRRLLVAAMAAEGFVVLHNEWWHFEHGTRYWAAVTGGRPRFGPASLPD